MLKREEKMRVKAELTNNPYTAHSNNRVMYNLPEQQPACNLDEQQQQAHDPPLEQPRPALHHPPLPHHLFPLGQIVDIFQNASPGLIFIHKLCNIKATEVVPCYHCAINEYPFAVGANGEGTHATARFGNHHQMRREFSACSHLYQTSAFKYNDNNDN